MRMAWAMVVMTAVPAAWGQSLDPLVADPQHYHLELENQWVRVIRERLAPADKMPMHQHPAPGSVIVFLTDRHNRFTTPDGTSQELRSLAGDLMWSPPSTHRSENLNNAPFEAVQIEPRRPANGGPAGLSPTANLDAPAIDPLHYHVEFENEYVRAIRVSLGPHEKLALHTHPATGAVLVHLTDQRMRLTLADGAIRDSNYAAKQVRWVPPGTAHQDENVSGAPLRFIRIELKLAVDGETTK